jgi:hypothetical protein
MIELTPYVPIVKMPNGGQMMSIQQLSGLTHSDVSRSSVQGSRCQSKTKDGDRFANGDVPSSLVVLAGCEGDDDGKDTGEQVWRAGEHECDDGTEAECPDDRGEEVLEAICTAKCQLIVRE